MNAVAAKPVAEAARAYRVDEPVHGRIILPTSLTFEGLGGHGVETPI